MVRRVVPTLVLGALVSSVLVAVPVSPAAASTTRCVGSGAGCYATLQGAIDASAAGDTVRVTPGTYAGGVRIAKNLTLAGAGAGRSVVRGGGPVITISPTGPGTPVVDITGLTVTGGLDPGGDDGVHAAGGGLFIPPAGEGVPGATVTLRNVTVTHNRARPRSTHPADWPLVCAEGKSCRFASAVGGGIASSGHLTLIDSVVSSNEVGGRATEARGGGIHSDVGSLTLRSSRVLDNRVDPVAIGRLVQGGGIYVEQSEMTLLDSSVSGNRADMVTRWPGLADVNTFQARADSGGIHLGEWSTARIERSRINDNLVTATDPVGEPRAFDSAMLADGATLEMRHSELRRNTVRVRGATTNHDSPSGQVAELDGTTEVSDTVVEGNHVSVVADRGDASAAGGLRFVNYFDFSADLARVVVRDNTVTARSRNGSAHAQAGGLWNMGSLRITGSTFSRNMVVAKGGDATARGGGVLSERTNGDPFLLSLVGSRVERNAAVTSRGGTASGGGLLSDGEVELRGTTIRRNVPDQCVGCTTR